MVTDDARATGTVRGPAARPPVDEVMRPAATTVEAAGHLAGAAYLMKRSGDSAIIVTADDGSLRPIAIITDADITQAVADGRDLGEARIHDLTLRAPITVERGTPVDEALRLMLSKNIQHLPVVDGGRLVGLVDLADACRALLAPGQGLSSA